MSDTSAVKSRKPLSLDEFRKQRKPLRNVNKEASEKLSALDRLACSITNRVGTMGFFLIVGDLNPSTQHWGPAGNK
jgi:uncharacterized membrane protein